jgi:hypothetical protein
MEGCNSKYYIPDMVNGRANLGLEEDAPMPCRICVQKREQERKKSEQERRRTEDESSQNLVANNNNNDGHLIISD